MERRFCQETHRNHLNVTICKTFQIVRVDVQTNWLPICRRFQSFSCGFVCFAGLLLLGNLFESQDLDASKLVVGAFLSFKRRTAGFCGVQRLQSAKERARGLLAFVTKVLYPCCRRHTSTPSWNVNETQKKPSNSLTGTWVVRQPPQEMQLICYSAFGSLKLQNSKKALHLSNWSSSLWLLRFSTERNPFWINFFYRYPIGFVKILKR